MTALNESIVLLLGVSTRPHPSIDDAPIIERFGAIEGKRLAAQATSIVEELNTFRPDWKKHALDSAADWAVEQLKLRHPELDDESADSLKWAYKWWWK